MVNAFLVQQAATPLAFYHANITPALSTHLSLSDPSCEGIGILTVVKGRDVVTKLALVVLHFVSML